MNNGKTNACNEVNNSNIDVVAEKKSPILPIPSKQSSASNSSNNYVPYNRFSSYNVTRSDKFINRNRPDRQLKYSIASLKPPQVPLSYSNIATSSPTPSSLNNQQTMMQPQPLKGICKPRSCSQSVLTSVASVSKNYPTISKTVSLKFL